MSIILQTGDYTLSCNVTPVPRPPGHFHVKFTSRLNTAKNPDESRTVFQFTGGGESLVLLQNVITQALETP